MTTLYNPDIKGLCFEIRQLRESVLRRAASIGNLGKVHAPEKKVQQIL